MSDWDFDGYYFVDDFGNPIPLDPSDESNYDPDPDCEDDSWHDADTFTSIGWGTDEDYGDFGGHYDMGGDW